MTATLPIIIRSEFTEEEMTTILAALELLQAVLKLHPRRDDLHPDSRRLLSELGDLCELDAVDLREHEIASLYQRLLEPLTVNPS